MCSCECYVLLTLWFSATPSPTNAAMLVIPTIYIYMLVADLLFFCFLESAGESYKYVVGVFLVRNAAGKACMCVCGGI